MSTEREDQLEEILKAFKFTETITLLTELLTLRREGYRSKLEASDNSEIRGRAKECKDLLQLFS